MKSIETFLAHLIRTPSQVAVDDLGQVINAVRRHLDEEDVPYSVVGPSRKPLAIAINPPQSESDEVLALDACLDTAPAGDLEQWHYPPFAGYEKAGWIYGRGSADSKAAVAIFSELARKESLNAKQQFKGRTRRVSMIFDCDEHSGRFGGIKAYTRKYGFPSYCAIGYPGIDAIVSGSRGFFRTIVTLRGHMGHAGSGTVPRELATTKLKYLISELDAINDIGADESVGFPLGPRASITWIKTGVKSFSVTPSRIDCALDLRLTQTFDASVASSHVERILAKIASLCGGEHASTLSRPNSWPAYKTENSALLPFLLSSAATKVIGRPPVFTVSGPSNIGNYLSMHGTEVLSGFGVDYKNIHGPDECVRLTSIQDVYRVYQETIRLFLGGVSAPCDG